MPARPKAEKKKKLVVIDGHALLHRAWHALPPLTTKKGVVINAAYGFLLALFKVWKDLAPTHAVVAFDLAGPTFRHKSYEAYKATREKQPDELYAQIPILQEALTALRIPFVTAEGFEADDVIGTIASRASKEKIETLIITGDLDTLQLVNDHTNVITFRKGLSDAVRYDAAAVKERYGLLPASLLEYRGLKGDPSDNIPGVKGIGEKTASALIQKFATIEKLYAHLETNKKLEPPLTPRLKEVLLAHKKEALMSRELSEIRCDVPLDFSLEKVTVQPPDEAKTIEVFQEYEFKSLLAKVPFSKEKVPSEPRAVAEKEKVTYVPVKTDAEWKKLISKLKKQKIFVLDTETTGLNPFQAELLGMSFSWKEGEAYYALLDGHPDRLETLRPILESERIKKWGHNIKYDAEILATAGIELKGIEGDTMLASYLLNPGSRAHNLDALAFAEFGHRMIPLTKLIGEKKPQKQMREVPFAELAEYSAEDSDFTWRLKERFEPELKKTKLDKLFYTIETPLIPVLAAMERAGVKVDVAHLRAQGKELGHRLEELEKKIWKEAGEKFNIASPLQLKKILFEKLKISTAGIGKTKTGLSTAAAELEKMKGEHVIIDYLLEYRELAKLKSTYLDALPLMADPATARIHTNYNQTIAATGRLSSIDPNLQNIPIRTAAGNEVRKAFVPEQGYVFVSADYSQIELRVVASLANDTAMINIFKRGEDIHTATAAKIHGLTEAEVTKAIRSTAKEINFGIIYGMGAWGLSARTGISQDEARDFIQKYFETFAGVKSYLEETKALAKKQGYVETLFGRRRYVPEIKSGMAQVRMAAERIAVNMPIQGTAADLMKVAMINIHAGLPAVSRESRMILQVHDELVFEVPDKDAEKVAAFAKEQMETVVKLKVPIEVHLQRGKNWGSMEPL